MKAYHAEKARDPSDLPKWLFAEHERTSAARSPSSSGREDINETEQQAPPGPRGLRDIYDAAAATHSNSGGSERIPPRTYPDEGSGITKASSRLKALRDAKRDAIKSNITPSNFDDQRVRDSGDGRHAEDHNRSKGYRRAPMHTGLPSGPVVRPRRS